VCVGTIGWREEERRRVGEVKENVDISAS